jgi:DNA-binding SARP family transcriptional activator
MEFRILGPLEVRRDGVPLSPGGPKQRALLALLLLHANEPVSRAALIDGLWGERPPETAAKALQVYVSQLRRTLGRERVRTQPGGYRLVLEPDAVDLSRFERLVAEARAATPAAAAPKLREAIGLWRGPALADVADEPFAQAEVGRLEELRLAAAEALAEAELALGRHAQLVPELEGLVAHNPLRERLRGQLMLALYRSGRQADALDAYQAVRSTLIDELGLEPGRALQELELSILRHDSTLDVLAPPVRSGSSAGFVGRESEITELEAALEGAVAGSGGLLLLAGEAGIGKTRLAEELAALARERNADVLWGRCWEAGGAPAYWPWTQAFRGYLRDHELAPAAELAPILPELGEGLPPSDPEQARFRLFEAAAGFLRVASAMNPLVLVLDDLHAADIPSAVLLRYLAPELASMRVLAVGTARTGELRRDQPLAPVLVELGRRAAQRFDLAGLAVDDVAALVEETTGQPASDEVATTIAVRTDGNPLFVTELARLIATDPLLETVPPAIRDVISVRARKLSARCADTLALASVLGRDFPLDVLAKLAGLERDELLEVLDEAVAVRLLVDVDGSPRVLRFSHALIRDALYEELPATRRLRLHRAAAETLVALRAGELGPHLAELAHHFAAADDSRASAYARRAGEHAARALGFEEAARLFEVALEFAPAEDRCGILLSLGEVQMRVGDTEVGKETFLRAADLARAAGDAESLARAALGYGERLMWTGAGEDRELVPLLEEALETMGEGHPALRALLLARLLGALKEVLPPERRAELAREGLALARAHCDDAQLSAMLLTVRVAAWGPDDAEAHLSIATEITELADRAGELERAIDGRCFRVESRMTLGDLPGTLADLEEAARVAEKLGQPTAHWHVAVHRLELALLQGRLEEAEELVDYTRTLTDRTHGADMLGTYHQQRYGLRRAQARAAEAEEDVRQLVTLYPERHSWTRCLLADFCTQVGRADEAEAILAELAAGDFSGVTRDNAWMLSIALLAEVAVAAREVRAAATLYELLAPYADLNVVAAHSFGTGSAHRSLGLLACVNGRREVAGRHFHEALTRNEAMGAAPWVAATQAALAQLAGDGHGRSSR